MSNRFLLLFAAVALMIFCSSKKPSGNRPEIKLMTLAPGHFHAALVQKTMYAEVAPVVHVYAPAGGDLEEHLKRIESYNSRSENPTAWQERVYAGEDYLAKMLADKPGNVVIIAGNNRRKMDYIKASVDAGLHVLADKPMCIDLEGFELLKQAFVSAEKNGVLLYDIMTERYEITTILQKALANTPEVFGELIQGSAETPAITKESVHHFFKYVSGAPLKRPAWFFDTDQQGEGIVDVSTHLVDLVQWECFPEQIINYHTDVEMLSARRWPTMLSKDQFSRVTQLDGYPDFLLPHVKNDVLEVFSNGEFIYRLKGVHAKVSVIWNFEAPAGAGDTHFSIMRGSKAEIIIRQGEEEKYRPELYVRPVGAGDHLEQALPATINRLAAEYPGLSWQKTGATWHVMIPDRYRTGHEAHFAQVAEKFLSFFKDGRMPDWEVPNMIAKYYTTTAALQTALTAE